ncbi:hypothetical protein STEG23_001891, partial [Scotinomys teguina]
EYWPKPHPCALRMEPGSSKTYNGQCELLRAIWETRPPAALLNWTGRPHTHG